MSNPIEKEGSDELDFDISSIIVDPKGVVPKLELEPDPESEPTLDPEPIPEPKVKGRPKKIQPIVAEPEPIEDPISPEPVIEPTLFQSLADKLGIELGEEEYEDSEEGLATFVQSTSDKLADAKLNTWLESLPPVASDFFDYIQMLGDEANEDSIQKFFSSVKPEIDYKSVDLESEDVQKAIMRTFYKKMDYDDAEIKDALEDLEIAGTLQKTAKVASTKLGAVQEKERAGLVAQQREADAVKKEQIQQYWGSVDATIKSGKVHSFSIPVAEQKAMLEYMSKPTKSGMPQLQEDLNTMSVEDRIALAVAVKNKFNLGKYITAAAKTVQANTLRDRLASNQGKLKSAGGAQNNGDDSISFNVK